MSECLRAVWCSKLRTHGTGKLRWPSIDHRQNKHTFDIFLPIRQVSPLMVHLMLIVVAARRNFGAEVRQLDNTGKKWLSL